MDAVGSMLHDRYILKLLEVCPSGPRHLPYCRVRGNKILNFDLEPEGEGDPGTGVGCGELARPRT